MKALDLFCGAGGASYGIASEGFEVTGLDLCDHAASYPFRFIHGDFLCLDIEYLRAFDFVWASPPCLAFTAYQRRPGHVASAANLIPETRALLEAAGVPWVIENVPGARAELRDPMMLCGSSFGLDIRRHRYFEASFPIPPVPCDHAWQTPRFPPATNRKNLRSTVEVGVWRIPLETQYKAMGGCEWMERADLSKAIPPVYSAHIARALKTHLLAGTEAIPPG